jgi:GT2 family glycosyltransferase
MINYNIIVANYGGHFAQNCNEGARKAKTKSLIFCNDDMVLNVHALWDVIDRQATIVGCRCVYPDGRPQYIGLGLQINPCGNMANEDGSGSTGRRVEYFMAQTVDECHYPSGGFFKIDAGMFWDAGKPDYAGFDEEYINGGEDQDLFMCALAKGASIDYCEIPVIHALSSSAGRFDHVRQSEKRMREKWLDNIPRLSQIFDFDMGETNA